MTDETVKAPEPAIPQIDAITFEMLEPYTDKYGMIHTNKVNPETREPSTANGLCYTAEAYIQATVCGNLSIFQVRTMMGEHWGDIVAQCEQEPGLLARSPTDRNQEGPDDYVGVGAAASVFGRTDIAERILDYGEKNKVKIYGVPFSYFYNNDRPRTANRGDGTINWSAWLGRQRNLIAHLQFAAHRKVSLLSQIIWCAAIISAARKGPEDQDAWRLSWLLLVGYSFGAQRTRLCDRAARYWTEQKRAKGITLRAIQAAYTNDPSHPFSTHWQEFDPNV